MWWKELSNVYITIDDKTTKFKKKHLSFLFHSKAYVILWGIKNVGNIHGSSLNISDRVLIQEHTLGKMWKQIGGNNSFLYYCVYYICQSNIYEKNVKKILEFMEKIIKNNRNDMETESSIITKNDNDEDDEMGDWRLWSPMADETLEAHEELELVEVPPFSSL